MTDRNDTAESRQQHHRDGAIACLASRLDRYQQAPIDLQVKLQPYLEQLSRLQQKLAQPLIQIAVFGWVSRGKSAVLNALFGEPLFPTGPLHGVTQWPRSVRWSPDGMNTQVPAVQLELIDTPGLDEICGEMRAAMAQDIARCADLILFVTAGPPLPAELAALQELVQGAKPLLWVVNKADLYPNLTAEAIYASLTDPTLQALLSPREIVLTAAAPAPVQVRHEWPDGRSQVNWDVPPVQMDGLRQTLMALLHREGLTLLSINVLVQTQALEQQIVTVIAQLHDPAVQAVQWRFGSIKALLIGILPWLWLDIVLSFAMDILHVRQISHCSGLPVTNHHIARLWRTLCLSLGWLGMAELGMMGWEGIPGVASAITQAGFAAYGATLVAGATQRHLVQGATWDPQGPSFQLASLLAELSPDTVGARLADPITATLAEE